MATLNLLERIIFWFVAVGLVVLSLVYFFGHVVQPKLPTGWDYKDVVSILLAIVTVALTVLGIIIAIAAFWGYQKITEAAVEKAEKASAMATDTFLGSTIFQTRLELLISEQMRNIRRDQIEPSLDVSSGQEDGAPGDQPWEDQ